MGPARPPDFALSAADRRIYRDHGNPTNPASMACTHDRPIHGAIFRCRRYSLGPARAISSPASFL
jgi:hypothetical protein